MGVGSLRIPLGSGEVGPSARHRCVPGPQHPSSASRPTYPPNPGQAASLSSFLPSFLSFIPQLPVSPQLTPIALLLLDPKVYSIFVSQKFPFW